MTVTLRKAGGTDLALVVALMNAAFRGREREQRGWSTEAAYITGTRTSESLLREEIAEHAEVFVVDGEEPSRLDGCVTLKSISDEKWYLGSLAVDPALQNSGLGRKILEAAENYAARHGASIIEITVVNVRHSLICWYERRGYQRTGEIRPFPYGDDRFGTPLRDDLDFVVMERHLASAAR